MRTRYIQQPDGTLYEVPKDYVQEPEGGVLLMTDIPGYRSPVTGLWVDGRRARREDLKRTGSRPYEGFDQEKKEADRAKAYQAEKNERILDKCAHEAFYQLAPSKRDVLKWHSERN